MSVAYLSQARGSIVCTESKLLPAIPGTLDVKIWIKAGSIYKAFIIEIHTMIPELVTQEV